MNQVLVASKKSDRKKNSESRLPARSVSSEPGEKKFESSHGYFTKDGSEFVITRPDTPRPWVNVFSNGDYGAIEAQTGSGFSWRGNSNLSRITRWEQDLIKDVFGKYLYIRDNDSGSYWSATYKPCCLPASKFEVRHGIGYSVLACEYNGIRSEKTFFVLKDDPAEVWQLRLTNHSGEPRRLSVFSYFEWCLGNAADTHREFQKTFIETYYDKRLSSIWGLKRAALVPLFISTGLTEEPGTAFHAIANQRAAAYEGDKENFFGRYGSLRSPKSVAEGKLSNTVGKHYDSIASLQADLALEPGETKTLIFVLGGTGDQGEAKRILAKVNTEAKVEKELSRVKQFWNELFEKTWIDTPDEAMNFMTNTWLKYQAICGRMWAKCGYYQSSGGCGFRDQLQDSHIFLPLAPEWTKKQILLHAEQQFPDGTVRHWWHPGTNIAAVTGMSDDLLWLAYLTLHYLEETADFSILGERTKFLPDPKTKKVVVGTLYDHCCCAIDRVLKRWSKRGLPLIGEGDWNDGMSHVGHKWKGESVWLGHFLYGILLKWIPMCERRRERTRALHYRKRAEALKKAINEHAWDGEWYIRATRDNGIPIGSKSEEEGKIFLNAQTWAVIHGTATPERAKQCMASAEKYLFREYGPLLFTPAYTKTDATIGYLSRYAPGIRENGGLYTHAGTWAIQAAAMMGDGNKAYKVYRSFMPILRGQNPDRYYCEPYVMPGNVDGPESPHFGRGGWTWYTGSAAWYFRVALNYILGLHAAVEGLQINPCIPTKWDGFKARRFFRGAVYEITVKNPNHVSTGVKKITVNGETIQGNLITPLKEKGSHKVVVTLG